MCRCLGGLGLERRLELVGYLTKRLNVGPDAQGLHVGRVLRHLEDGQHPTQLGALLRVFVIPHSPISGDLRQKPIGRVYFSGYQASLVSV